MKNSGILLIGFIVALMTGCSKDPAPAEAYFFMDNEFRDYTFFKPGSWWVYSKDSASVDSVAVISSQFILQEPDSADYSWQQSRLTYTSSFYKDTTHLLGDFVPGAAIFYLKQVNDSGSILNFFSLKPPGYVLNLGPSLQMHYRETKDTTINGQAFGGVKIFENLVTPSNNTLPKVIWYARNLGIIRKELFNGEIWFLDRYNILQ